MLEIKGFKSFGLKRAVIKLDKELTVITGPNGSGKSNILDAVRFVLGDLSPRSLRANKMAEIIFDGSPVKNPARVAYVKITFDNSDRKIPIDKNVITVTRRIKRTGISEYLLNGRRASRNKLVDILRMSGLSSSGYNIIMQGTITRLADITPEERRRSIEDLVGISHYNTKKAEAIIQLKQAETNLMISLARIGDVQKRLEKLEEEKNEGLRHNFISKEVEKLHAILHSFRIDQLRDEKNKLKSIFDQKKAKVRDLQKQKEILLQEKNSLELQRRRFDDVSDEGHIKIVAIQKEVGDVMANVAALKMEMRSEKDNLSRLNKIGRETLEQLKDVEQRICETEFQLSNNFKIQKELKREFDAKRDRIVFITDKLIEAELKHEIDRKKISKIEDDLKETGRKLLSIDIILKGINLREKITTDAIQLLKERKGKFNLTLKTLLNHLEEIQKLWSEEQVRLSNVSASLQNQLSGQQLVINELEKAKKTLSTAQKAILKVEVENKLATMLPSEDSLRLILGEIRHKVPGVFGRVDQLIKINPKFKKPIYAASLGWLKAILVKDIETVFRCMEHLNNAKVGKIKFIPLEEVEEMTDLLRPTLPGLIGHVAQFVESDKSFSAAISFIFGDTIIVCDEKSAILALKAGHRAVDLNGNLYEVGGGIVSGNPYGQIIEYQFLTDHNLLNSFFINVHKLISATENKSEDIKNYSEIIVRLKRENIRLSEDVKALERNRETVEDNIIRTKHNITIIDKRIINLTRRLEKEKEGQFKLESEKIEHNQSFKELNSLTDRIKLESESVRTNIELYESEKSQLTRKESELNGRIIKIENEVYLLKNSLTAILKPQINKIRTENNSLNGLITTTQKNIDIVHLKIDDWLNQLTELEQSKESLSLELSSSREKRKDIERQIDNIDRQLSNIGQRHDQLSLGINKIAIDVERKEFDTSHINEELEALGYDGPLSINDEEEVNVKTALNLMSLELEKLGAVNQLAIIQYIEEQEKYKQLSLRRNQLETEKGAILDFMEEIEKRKIDAFMEALTHINEAFKIFFFKLTGGGDGYLRFQKPEDPFSGGIDLFVKFPGKATRLISGSSGGEKSVAAVSFLFAIQELAPAPFYILDEIGAHLDPQNSERLADLLKEQSESSQVMAITLREVIMDRASRLIGVYVQNGISRIVTTTIIGGAA